MNLSYLDILLGTTMIFVVLFGLSARNRDLPEPEGKALVLVVAAPRPAIDGKAGSLELELRYHYRQGPANETRTFQFGDNDPRTETFHDLVFDSSEWRSNRTIQIRGQPDRDASLEVSARARIPKTKYLSTLFERQRHYAELGPQLSPHDRRLLTWVMDGEQLVAAATTRSVSDQMNAIRRWLASSPLSNDTLPLNKRPNLYRELQIEAEDRSTEEEIRLARIDLITYALLIHDALRPVSKLIPTDEPKGKNKPILESFSRVTRHLECKWGETVPQLAGPTSCPSWCRTKTIEWKRMDERAYAYSEEATRRFLRSPSGGMFALDDSVATDAVAPLRAVSSYAGQVQAVASPWRLMIDDDDLGIDASLTISFP